jgi:hypothetical protein
VWIGSVLDGIDGLTAGDPVTAEQMRALFGCGLHPLAELRQQQLGGPDLTQRDYQDAARLGAPFKIFNGQVSPSASKSPNASERSRRPPAFPPALRYLLASGRGYGLRSPVNSSWPSMVGSQSTPGNSQDKSRKTPARGPTQLPGMT